MRSKRGSDPPIKRGSYGDVDAVRVDRRGSRWGASEVAVQAQAQPQQRSRGGGGGGGTAPVPQRRSSGTKVVIPPPSGLRNALIHNDILNKLGKKSKSQKQK